MAEYFKVPYLSSSAIAREATGDEWMARGDMAPEPDTTFAIERAVAKTDQWVLDGFPRSEFQLRTPFIRREVIPIVYLDVADRQAFKRLKARPLRGDERTMAKRVHEQRELLVAVKALAAVIIPTSFRSPEQVNKMIVDWLLHDIHPSHYGSQAR